MITLHELNLHLNEYLDVANYKDYCDNGIQVEGKTEIHHIATAVSASLAAIEAAVNAGAQALLVHHGMFWNGDSYAICGSKREKLHLLLQNNISLLAYHLPLDGHFEIGNNWKAAKDLGWRDLEPFGEYRGRCIGVKGRFPEQELSDFQNSLEVYYQHQAHVAFGGKTFISSAALVSGGAYKLVSEAVQEKVDCFITGNFDEPVWNQAFEEKINFFALGHSATEKTGIRALGEYLKEMFSLKHTFIDIPNPF